MPNTSQLSKYIKAEHVKDGDVINFMDAGIIADKEFTKDGVKEIKTILELSVEIKGERKLYSPNQTTIGILSKAWTADTEKWVGKQGRITLVPSPLGKDMVIVKPIEPADIQL